MAGVFVPIVADARKLLAAFHKSSEAADMFGRDLKQLSLTAEQSAKKQIDAAVRRDRRLRGEIAAYRQVAQAAQKGSREQVAAANLATRAEERLARSLAVTSREAKEHARAMASAERQAGKFGRGVFAGSGLAGGLGRSLAFASGGFLASASISEVLRVSIEQGSKALAVQRQLAAQFRASGQDLAVYQKQIDETSLAVSRLSGFEDDELKAAFVTAFRGSQDVSVALKIQAVAADVARGRHIELSAATIALTKAYGGQATALKRLGVQVPTTLKGMEAINFVARRFAGQAEAGATSQDKFRAALANTEQTIGKAVLPAFTKLLDQTTEWLANEKHQQQISTTVSTGMTVLGKTVQFATSKWTPFGLAIRAAALAMDHFNKSAKAFTPPGLGGPVGQQQFRGQPPGLGGPTPPAHRASLSYQISLALEQLAKAELTATTRDNRAVLVRLEALTRQKIAKTKELGARTALEQTLGSYESQIAAIDAKTAANAKTAADARKAAAKKRADAEKERHQKDLEQFRRYQQQAREIIRKGREQAAAAARVQKEMFKQATDTARGLIGGLFSGPVLNFGDDQRKAALGIPNTAADPRALVRDLNAQVAQAKAFQRNLGILKRRGAPTRLLNELLAGGIGNAPEAAALAGASKGTLAGFFSAFAAREKAVRSVALTARAVTIHADAIVIDGVTYRSPRVRVKQSAAQRRGPVPGRGDPIRGD